MNIFSACNIDWYRLVFNSTYKNKKGDPLPDHLFKQIKNNKIKPDRNGLSSSPWSKPPQSP